MKKLLLGSALPLFLLATPSFAADMSYPVKAQVVAVVPAFSWTGLYLGASAGYGWGEVGKSGDWANYLNYYYDGYDAVNSTGALKPEGWFVGGQIGYNYQLDNNVVLGVEADIFFADKKDSSSYSAFDAGFGSGLQDYGSVDAKLEAFGTIRARVGYAFDRLLPYVTGGFAWGRVKASEQWASYNNGVLTETGSYSSSDTQWGWTIGGGMEYAFADNWTVKAEYLYSDLGSLDYDSTANADFDVISQTVKVGVNYKF